VQRTGEREIGDVVPGRRRQRAVLAPSGHPRVHQPRVERLAFLRAEPEPLRDTRPEALDQDVRGRDQPAYGVEPSRVLQIERHRPAAAGQQLQLGRAEHQPAAGPVDPEHVGSQLGQQHRSERRRPDPRELDHPHPGQRSLRHAHHCDSTTVTIVNPTVHTLW
jgi:hypothetical protein